MLKKLMGATGLGVVFAATASLGAYAQVAPPVIEPVEEDADCVTITQERVDDSGNIILDDVG